MRKALELKKISAMQVLRKFRYWDFGKGKKVSAMGEAKLIIKRVFYACYL